MLSRLAESLYWIGRYIERADDTARIVDSYVHRMVEDPFNDEDATCRSLYSILGIDVESDEPVTTVEMLQHIVYDAENPNSIAGSLSGAFENARRSREFISSEMWVALNSTRNRLPQMENTARRLGPSQYLLFVRERAALLAGLTDATLESRRRLALLGPRSQHRAHRHDGATAAGARPQRGARAGLAGLPAGLRRDGGLHALDQRDPRRQRRRRVPPARSTVPALGAVLLEPGRHLPVRDPTEQPAHRVGRHRAPEPRARSRPTRVHGSRSTCSANCRSSSRCSR